VFWIWLNKTEEGKPMNQPKFSEEYIKKSTDILEYAIKNLGAYKGWQAFDPGLGRSIDERYAAMPVITKKEIRENFPQGFVPPDKDVDRGIQSGEINFVKTSGSSDAFRVTNIWHQGWWDASEVASWELNAHASRLATGEHPEAILVNARNVGIISDEADLPFEKRRLDRFLYLNEKTDPTTWTPRLMDRMIEELEIFKPSLLEANASFLARLCRYITANKKKVYQPGLIVFTYEFPSRLAYQQVGKVFKCPAISSYGSTETGYVLMQCEHGKLHQNTKSCRLDFQPLKPEHGGPDIGRMLVTTFDNPWYFMLRFDVGDFARLDKKQKCACGRDNGYIITDIEGRWTNVTFDTQGNLVTLNQLDKAISTIKNIDEYRLEQPDHGAYRLFLVSQRKDRDKLTKEAEDRLRKVYGEQAQTSIVFEETLAPEDSGKYSLAKTLFTRNDSIDEYIAKTPQAG
jgi:phenylacetate-coenzyme A ligase PaaK-like adenylate-forming protein